MESIGKISCCSSSLRCCCADTIIQFILLRAETTVEPFFQMALSGLFNIICCVCLMSEMLRNPVGRHLRHGTGIHVQQNNLRDVVIETAAFRLSSCTHSRDVSAKLYKPLIRDSSSLLLLYYYYVSWQRNILMCCYSPIECIKIIMV